MDNRKILRRVLLGTYSPGKRSFASIRYVDGRLSICFEHGPTRRGDADSCGQANPREWVQAVDGTLGQDSFDRLVRIWKRWHLNDMRAGNPAQEQALREAGGKVSFGADQDLLASQGLLVSDGYRYGSAWLREDVPEDVLAFLETLPQTDSHPWGNEP